MKGLRCSILVGFIFSLVSSNMWAENVVLFDFEKGKPKWWCASWGAEGKANWSIQKVKGRNGGYALRLISKYEGGIYFNSPHNWSLPPDLRAKEYKGISLWYRVNKCTGSNLRFRVIAKNIDGKEESFIRRIPVKKEWQKIEISESGFWSRSRKPPRLSTIKFVSIGVDKGEISIDIDDIELLPKGNSFFINPEKVKFIYPVEKPPEIDGNINDSCWKNASSLKLELVEPGKKIRFPTQVKICYDKNALYISARQFIPEGGKLTATVKTHDGPVWEDDCFEVFLDPHHTHTEAYHLIVNVLGTKFESSTVSGKGWDGLWKASTKKGNNFWDVEIAIPYSSLGVVSPEAGTSWGFNIKRIFYGGSKKIVEHTGWSTLNHKGIRDFGDLVFCSSSSSPHLLRNVEVYIPKAGIFKIIFPVEDFKGSMVANLSISLPGEKRNVEKKVNIPSGSEKGVIENIISVKEKGNAKLFLSLLDEKEENLLGYISGSFPVSPPVKEVSSSKIVLWPPPHKIKWKNGYFVLDSSACIYKKSGCPSFPPAHFQKKIIEIYGIRLRVGNKGKKIEFGLSSDKRLKKEGYLLEVTPSKIKVEGADERGLYYGMRTLLSLIEQSSERGKFPRARCVEIKDWPDLPFRILFMRVDWRHKKGPVFTAETMNDFIYRCVAGNKYNALILVLRDAYKYQSHPEIRFVVKHQIDKEVVKKIVAFAKKHYVEVIPGGNSPGHADWICYSHPELREDGDRHTLCTSHPDTYPLLFDLYDELCEIIPSRYFHIGHDEVRWKTDQVPPEKRCKFCAGKEKRDLLLEDIIKLRNHFKKKGMRVMMWNDMLIPEWNGGGKYQTWKIRDKIPRDVIMMPWGRIGEPIKPFVDLGFTVIRASTSWGQKSLDDFFKDYSLIKGDCLNLFTISPPWLTFSLQEYRHNKYNFLMVAHAGGCFWNKEVAKERLIVRIRRMGNHIARQFLEIPQIHASGKFIPIDISSISNKVRKKELSNFPIGKVKIAGIPFLFSNKICAPEKETPPIPVGKKINSFFVMHTLDIPAKEILKKLGKMSLKEGDEKGLVIGWYRIKYEDGSIKDIPLRLGYNIYHWDGAEYGRYLYKSRWTWTGGTPEALKKDPYARNIGIQQVEILNPYPEKKVVSITLINRGFGGTPILLGLTLEEVK